MFPTMLMATNDVRLRDPDIEKILLNTETIAINRAPTSFFFWRWLLDCMFADHSWMENKFALLKLAAGRGSMGVACFPHQCGHERWPQ